MFCKLNKAGVMKMARRRAAHLREVLYGLRVSPEGSCAGRVVLSAIVGRWNLLGGAVYEALWPTGVLQTFKRSEREPISFRLSLPRCSRLLSFSHICHLLPVKEGRGWQEPAVFCLEFWLLEL